MESAKKRVAVLYQALDPPVIQGVFKPKKPGGYCDSSADIAYALSQSKKSSNIEVITPVSNPDPSHDASWSFPDTEAGILDAVVSRGATHIWANTILFSSHPLQASPALAPYLSSLHIVGQPPQLVDAYDDKALMYRILRRHGGFTIPRSTTVQIEESHGDGSLLLNAARDIGFPLVAKPIRGRGSHGVKVCKSEDELVAHSAKLLVESGNTIILEVFLSGEEATVTVMPPFEKDSHYKALPVVTRFGHVDGVAPYNGIVAVTANSRVVTPDEAEKDPAYSQVMQECQLVAELLGVTAPIRIDVRREKEGGSFMLFDINMKPNMTGPGRPGRDDQLSLTAMAANGLGWDYSTLLQNMLASAATLEVIRSARAID